jgi:molecular chaperone DnaK
MIFQTEKQMKEFSEKLTEDDKTKLNSDLTLLKEAHSQKDIEKIDECCDKLNKTWSDI